MMKPKIKDGVKGKAMVICRISESPVDCAVFNAIVDTFFKRPLETTEEIDKTWELEQEHMDMIVKALEDVMIADESDGELIKVYNAIMEKLKDVNG